MKLRYVMLGAAVFSIVWSSGALSQSAPPLDPVPLKLSRQHLQIIGNGLQELPAKLANPVLNDLQQQLNDAEKAHQSAEAAKKAPDDKPKKP